MKRMHYLLPLLLLCAGISTFGVALFTTTNQINSLKNTENGEKLHTVNTLLTLLYSVNVEKDTIPEHTNHLFQSLNTTLSRDEQSTLKSLLKEQDRKSASRYILTLIQIQYEHAFTSNNADLYSKAFILFAIASASFLLSGFTYVFSQRKKLRQSQFEIEKTAIEAQQASQSKSDFLASMSHEIRTPMNGIIGMTSLLLNSRLNSEQKHYAEVIQSSGENLLTIVNDILDFSKIEAGKLELDLIPFALPTLLEETMDVIAYKSAAKSLELINIMPLDLPYEVKGDPVRLRQILLNLVGNAVKFTHEGEVVLTSEVVENLNRQPALKCTITDTGIGMTAEQIDTLFHPFTQAEQSTTRMFGGTGLGLAISKQLTEMMGGEIHVTSEINQGSTFWFTIPLEVVLPAQELPYLENLENEHILIIDNNETNRTYLESLFSSWNIPTKSAATMEDTAVLLATAEQPFTATVIDNNLPGKSGSQVATLLKESLTANANQVVMIPIDTINDTEFYVDDSIRAITKPIRPAELLEKLFNNNLLSNADDSDTTFEKKNCSIMVVEDNLTNQEVAKALFSSLGYGITIANNGREALQILAEGEFDIVFMDCQMPEMDGYEATRRIRENSNGTFKSDVPIIAMTAHAMKGDRDRCLASGMNEYISKPISPLKIKEMLSQFIIESRITSESTQASLDNTPEDTQDNSSWGGLPVFNKSELIKRFGGDESLLEIIIPAFIEDTTRLLEELNTAIENASDKAVAELGHSMKGASANISAESFSSKAMEIEKAGKAQESSRYSDLYKELYAEFQKLESELRMEL